MQLRQEPLTVPGSIRPFILNFEETMGAVFERRCRICFRWRSCVLFLYIFSNLIKTLKLGKRRKINVFCCYSSIVITSLLAC